MARAFLREKCEIGVEVPTVAGKKTEPKKADLKVTKHDEPVYVHVKRVNPEERRTIQSNIAKRFGRLEKIKEPLLIEIFLNRDITDQEAVSLASRAWRFVENADVGDVQSFQDDRGKRFAECRVLGPYPQHIKVWPHYWPQKVTDRERIKGRLSSACEQFMPNAVNLIFLTGNFTIMVWNINVWEIESVLLGRTSALATHYLDGSPSEMLNTGRSPDGFWSKDTHSDCDGVCYFDFRLNRDPIQHKLWVRPGSEAKIPEWLTAVFPP